MEYDKVQAHLGKMKKTFDKKIKEGNFQINDLVLKWDARKEDKHGKFNHLWKGTYIVLSYLGYNSLFCKIKMGLTLEKVM